MAGVSLAALQLDNPFTKAFWVGYERWYQKVRGERVRQGSFRLRVACVARQPERVKDFRGDQGV
eukprot:10544331-Lingulodinium_polyedra.AAC.1